ncbi:hypothetical protein D3C80_2138250 [compost metagenome]
MHSPVFVPYTVCISVAVLSFNMPPLLLFVTVPLASNLFFAKVFAFANVEFCFQYTTIAITKMVKL